MSAFSTDFFICDPLTKKMQILETSLGSFRVHLTYSPHGYNPVRMLRFLYQIILPLICIGTEVSAIFKNPIETVFIPVKPSSA